VTAAQLAALAADKHAAHRLLASLRVGDVVTVTEDSRDSEMTVQRELSRPGGVGSWDGDAVVKVGYGPGRYNREISAGTIAGGYVALRRAE
jgi:hypothetical protein